jgi:uncharacterized phage protein (predicted DNA packaging)
MPLTLSTTSPVTLEEAKAHLRIDGTADDSYLTRLLIVATQFFELEAQASIASLDPVPELVRHGILMVLGHLYENREAAVDRRIDEVPLGVQRIVHQFWSPEVA